LRRGRVSLAVSRVRRYRNDRHLPKSKRLGLFKKDARSASFFPILAIERILESLTVAGSITAVLIVAPLALRPGFWTRASRHASFPGGKNKLVRTVPSRPRTALVFGADDSAPIPVTS
jgi:hypothetical protein